MLALAGLVLALLAPALALAQTAPATTTLAPDAEARWVSFTLTPYNQIRFAMELDGRAIDAILDTGLSDTIVTSTFASRNGIVPDRETQGLAIGGSVPVAWADAPVMTLGGLTRRGGRIGVIRSAQEARFGADMLVGADVLGCCGLDIDFDARRFRILPSGRLPFTGQTMRLGRHRTSGVYTATLTFSGKAIAPVIVDTGDGSSLTLGPAAWRQLRPAGLPVTTALGWGIGGAVVSELAVLPALSLAGGAAMETEVRIEGERGFLASAAVAGRAGAALLQRFRVLLDPKAGRMVLQPGKAFATPVTRSTSGLLIEAAGDQLNVVHVMRGSPAAAANWRAGERICAADGAPPGTRPEWVAGEPGRAVTIRMCDGSERRLTLARFY